MKKATANVFNQVKIILNTTNPSRHQWAKIVNCHSGRTLHTGQPSYIKRIAQKKYNMTF